MIVLQETLGKPDCMIVCHLPLGPTAYFNISNVVMRHDTPGKIPVSEEYPHLLFFNLTTNLGKRVEFSSFFAYTSTLASKGTELR